MIMKCPKCKHEFSENVFKKNCKKSKKSLKSFTSDIKLPKWMNTNQKEFATKKTKCAKKKKTKKKLLKRQKK